eukprot:11185043-Lingulodinium_polyedra.AAC.1
MCSGFVSGFVRGPVGGKQVAGSRLFPGQVLDRSQTGFRPVADRLQAGCRQVAGRFQAAPRPVPG